MSSCTRCKRRAGAATVEAVIVIPVLLILLIGVLWVRDLASERQQARAEARSCTWRYALPGCKEVPDDCEPPSQDAPEAGQGRLLDGLSDIPVVGEPVRQLMSNAINVLFGETARFEVERQVARNSYTRTVRSSVAVVCNSAPTTPGKVLEHLLCDKLGLPCFP